MSFSTDPKKPPEPAADPEEGRESPPGVRRERDADLVDVDPAAQRLASDEDRAQPDPKRQQMNRSEKPAESHSVYSSK